MALARRATDTRLGEGRACPGWSVLAGGATVAIAVVVLLALDAGAGAYRELGVTDPGALVRLGTAVLRVVADIASAMCVGALAFVVALTPPGPAPDRLLTASGYRALRGAAAWGALWCAAACAMMVFSAVADAGLAPGMLTTPTRLLGLVDAQEEPRTWLLTAAMAALVATSCRWALTWRPTLALTVVAVLALLPPLAAGHSSSDTDHDIATAAIAIHVPAAAIWVGLLATVVMQAARRPARQLPVMRRYARIAAVCWVVAVGSGLVDAAVLVPGGGPAGWHYRWVLVGKVVIVAVLGVGCWVGHRRAIRVLEAGGPDDRRSLFRVLALEWVVLLASMGLSAALSQLYPPAFARPVSIPQTLLGYDLAGPPTLSRLAWDWRVEVLFGCVAVLLAAGYVWAVWRLHRTGQRWPVRRSAAWLGGCAVLLVATCSGLGRYEPAMFSVHMASHMLIAVVVPGLWVQAAPLTLLSQVGAEPVEGLPGVPDWLSALTSSGPARLLTHPLAAFSLFAGSPFAFYFSGAFDASARFHWAHMAVDAYFLIVGLLFAWPTIGVDPAPHPVPNLVRVGMLLAASPFTAVFAALVIASPRVLGDGPVGYNMYSSLHLPWIHGVPGLLADQRLGGLIALVIGEVGLFAAVVVLLVRWAAVDEDPLASGPDLSAQLRSPEGITR